MARTITSVYWFWHLHNKLYDIGASFLEIYLRRWRPIYHYMIKQISLDYLHSIVKSLNKIVSVVIIIISFLAVNANS